VSINAWADQLFGPEPPPAPPGEAAFGRFRRITGAQNVAAGLQRQRDLLIAGLPRMPSRHEHVPLALHQPDYGACGAWSCDFLGPSRDGEDEAIADAESHRAEAAGVARHPAAGGGSDGTRHQLSTTT